MKLAKVNIDEAGPVVVQQYYEMLAYKVTELDEEICVNKCYRSSEPTATQIALFCWNSNANYVRVEARNQLVEEGELEDEIVDYLSEDWRVIGIK